MTEFQFQLFCRDVENTDDLFLERLFEAGCGDATVFFKDGYACLDFARQADSAEQAIVSAIKDFERASVGGAVVRVEPEDLASLAEIAKRVGVTRASLQKYARGVSKVGQDFPRPAQNISSPRRELFSTFEIMRWMQIKQRTEIPDDSIELFRAIANANHALAIAKAREDKDVNRLLVVLSARPGQPAPGG